MFLFINLEAKVKRESQFLNDWNGYNNLTIYLKFTSTELQAVNKENDSALFKLILSLPRSKRMKSLPLSRVTKCKNLKKEKGRGKKEEKNRNTTCYGHLEA